jgi:hypothetical protein
MTKQEYNGWTNYETWNLKLWIDNDESSQNFWIDQARQTLESAEPEEPFTKEERAALTLSKSMEQFFEDLAQDALGKADAESSWIADFLHAAVSEVNFYEIAQSFLANVEQTQIA